tara:strand:+ start:112 stop:291 length:180 start_codon:yes stop_codon:yes gene_type:complete
MDEIFRLLDMNVVLRYGAIAQLVEHLHGMQGVSGSSPLGSIKVLASYKISLVNFLNFKN